MMTELVSYYLDQLIECDRKDRLEIVEDTKKRGYFDSLEEELEEYYEEKGKDS